MGEVGFNRFYVKKKKNRIDICNICGNTAELTWEHVPPQSCGNNGPYHINPILQIDESSLKLDSQNGIKYRSICAKCNNELLGANADKALASLYQHTKSFLEQANSISDTTVISINLIDTLKCIFGKLLAMDKEYCNDTVSQAMRAFILHNDILPDLHVYFRIYPYNTSIQARSFGTKQVSGDIYSTEGFISVLYFYPLAFIVSSNKEPIALTDLMAYADFAQPNKKIRINIGSAFNPVTGAPLPYNWLIDVDDRVFVLADEQFTNIVGQKKKRK